jgi:hypothetical protein
MTNLTLKKFNEVRVTAVFEGNVLVFTFSEKAPRGEKLEKPEIYHIERFDLSKLPQKIFLACDSSRHGMKQKLADSYAMNKAIAEITTLKEVVDNTVELYNQLVEGNWTAKRVGSKGETIALSSLESQFVAQVIIGTLTRAVAETLYKGITGKELPPQPKDEVEESPEGEDLETEKDEEEKDAE